MRVSLLESSGRLFLALIVASLVASCSSGGNPTGITRPFGLSVGLVSRDLVVGTGARAEAGKMITVDYEGWLADGTKFDSSIDRGQPFHFLLGARQVIPGWDQGVRGMRVGGKRRLVIPPQLAYGAQGAPPVVPPNATLIFEISLLDVSQGPTFASGAGASRPSTSVNTGQ